MKIKLVKPILLTETATPIEELNLREEICAGDMRFMRVGALADPTIDDLLTLAARLTGQGAAVLNKLGMRDMDALVGSVAGFLVAGLETGKTQ